MSEHRTFTTSVTAMSFDIDAARHVSNLTYVRWLEVARNEFLTEIGAPIEALMDDGVAPIVARTDIRYRHPVQLEPLDVRRQARERAPTRAAHADQQRRPARLSEHARDGVGTTWKETEIE